MTDGVSDPYFETEANLTSPAKWSALWDEIEAKAMLSQRDPEIGIRLLNWLDFWSAGNHDDRTLAVTINQVEHGRLHQTQNREVQYRRRTRRAGSFHPDNHRLMVYSNQSLFHWHANRNIVPNEKITDAQKKRIGYFIFHNKAWYLVNESMPDLVDLTQNDNRIPVPPGDKVVEGQKPGMYSCPPHRIR